jgi:hypothetical protein
MEFITKELKLGELVELKNIYFKLYLDITDFKQILELEEQVVEPIDKILKLFNKKVEQLRKDLSQDPSKQEETDKIYNEILNSEVSIKLAKVGKDILEKGKFNVFEYRAVKELISS